MFIDASAIVAILGEEEAAASMLASIERAKSPIYYSSLVVFEAAIALARKKKIAAYGENAPTPPYLIERAAFAIEGFLNDIGAVELPIAPGTHHAALSAARTYGRFIGHPAKLNFGDCFSYAAAKTLQSPLLFVGKDFSKTDVEVA
ncbi:MULTISPECIES: type II toxin-antitoxin system VapC family toxin [unclassified Neorhizobium]|uniref:type II toxin-antitoxin system VapC family toxin n=1 Tax=unclassified Neorhizobium TaxID=2629175 RepID=UPI001FF61043|nr:MULTISPECIES: type II toxin-antitoxin system VapC family toxin [unclassified Neorhizobium]MCJ9674589.1 type II toxin-antitoxin system VapC family toxin [Neorhizobium sp. SHOUNA12B]MCJ9746391.1 type II toxin-antitoxin system VapC family toxin [Neorhizobium sp. SHOUNA12A]